MSEDKFWNSIQLINWQVTDNKAKLTTLINELANLPDAEIVEFEHITTKLLYDLDGDIFAKYYLKNGTGSAVFSVDDFLYSRAFVVAMGMNYYYQIVQNPNLFPGNSVFEDLLYAAQRAFKQKNGHENWAYTPKLSYETFSNNKLWNTNNKNLITELISSKNS